MDGFGACASSNMPILAGSAAGITAITTVAIIIKYFMIKKDFLSQAASTVSSVAPAPKTTKKPSNPAPRTENKTKTKPTRVMVSPNSPTDLGPKSPVISPSPNGSRVGSGDKSVSTGRSTVSSGRSLNSSASSSMSKVSHWKY